MTIRNATLILTAGLALATVARAETRPPGPAAVQVPAQAQASVVDKTLYKVDVVSRRILFSAEDCIRTLTSAAPGKQSWIEWRCVIRPAAPFAEAEDILYNDGMNKSSHTIESRYVVYVGVMANQIAVSITNAPGTGAFDRASAARAFRLMLREHLPNSATTGWATRVIIRSQP